MVSHAGFGQTEMLHLAGRDQVLDRARHILDRHVGIDAMLVEQVDPIGAQALQASIRNRFDVRGLAVGAAAAFAGRQIDIETEFGGNDDLVADRGKRFANQFLIDERAVSFRRVEQGDAAIDVRRG